MLWLNNLRPSGEEMKAKNEKHLTRAREERGDACPNSPEDHTRPVIASAIHPMAASALAPQRKTMRRRSFRCSKQGATLCYEQKAFVLFKSMWDQRFVAHRPFSLKTFATGNCGPRATMQRWQTKIKYPCLPIL